MRITACSLFLGAILALGGCSSRDVPSRSEPAPQVALQAIEGGEFDTQSKAVFFLINGQRGSGAMCTATLIAPNLLLTARHCVAPADGENVVVCGRSSLGAPYDGTVFHTTNDAEPSRTSLMFRGRPNGARVPIEGSDTCGYDMALLILENNVPSSIAVPAVPRIDKPVADGEAYVAVGYGVDASNDWTGGRMRLEGLKVACAPGQCGFGVEATEFRGDRGTCSGDSGGPALDAFGRVLGVVSRATQSCDSPIYGTVFEWRQWIVEVAREAAGLGGYDAPTWVTTGRTEPPDSTGTPPRPDPTVPGEPTPPSTQQPIIPKGAQGDACRAETDCSSGFACYTPDGQLTTAYCAARCSESVQCAPGLVCIDRLGVCLATTEDGAINDEASGCNVASVASPRTSRTTSVSAALGLLALLTMRRRKPR